MKAVSSRLDRRANDAALIISELGGGILSNQIEFLNRIRRRSKPNQVVRYLVVIHAVENEVVCLLAVAVDVRPSSAGGVVAVVETLRIRGH